ncbi:MAG TPA: VanW family protein [Kofleriaceae bacterium]|nr:VanW family protein [Kofleriaceae bacterium]
MNGSVLLGLSGLLLLGSGGLLAYFFLAGSSNEGIAAAQAAASGDDQQRGPVQTVDVAALGEAEVALTIGKQRATRTWKQLGLIDHDGRPALDRDAAAAAVRELKGDHDSAPINARMDMPARKVYGHKDGVAIDLQQALAALETSALTGNDEVELPVTILPASFTTEQLGIEDISHVLATFTTKFAVAEKYRNDNLKLAASKLDGYVLQPGVEFSFNDVVGPRTEKEGYKIAHVIVAGEMVDGDAGGTCQISTTLHGAAFFAGLDILKGRPHSRPSTYVEMGLDATVVYPHADVKLKNPYDFPIVISYKVARGESTVEILGKARPYDQIAFEREVLEKLAFDTVTRQDMKMPIGSMVVDQLGFPGYRLNRYRKFYKDGKVVKTNKWPLDYKPVTEYVRVGANPDPNLPPPKASKPHGPKPPSSTTFRMVQ